MALISCRSCGAQIAPSASVCPYCGIAGPAATNAGLAVGALVAIGLAVFVFFNVDACRAGLIRGTQEVQEEAAKASRSYDQAIQGLRDSLKE